MLQLLVPKLIEAAAKEVLPALFDDLLRAPAVTDKEQVKSISTTISAHAAAEVTKAVVAQIPEATKEQSKTIWASRRFWSAVFALLAVVGSFYGVTITDEQSAAIEAGLTALPAAVGAVLALWSILKPSLRSVRFR